MNRPLYYACILGLLAGLWGSPSFDAELSPEQKEAIRQVQAAPKRGLLYQVKSGTNLVYLFGTIHVGKKEFYPLNVRVTQAMANSKVVYFETNIAETDAQAKAMAAVAQLHDGKTLADVLPESLMKKVDAELYLLGMPRAQAVKMKPWLLGTLLELTVAARAGFDPNLGAESYLLGLARGMHKTIDGLESWDEQFATFAKLTDEEQQEFLAEVIDDVDSGRGATAITALAEAWASADRAQVEQALARLRAEGGDSQIGNRVMQLAIDDRNTLMADRITDILRYAPTSFVAIGAGHLVGANNVIDLLRKRGFQVDEF